VAGACRAVDNRKKQNQGHGLSRRQIKSAGVAEKGISINKKGD
jgi:hypothetical protein